VLLTTESPHNRPENVDDKLSQKRKRNRILLFLYSNSVTWALLNAEDWRSATDENQDILGDEETQTGEQEWNKSRVPVSQTKGVLCWSVFEVFSIKCALQCGFDVFEMKHSVFLIIRKQNRRFNSTLSQLQSPAARSSSA
jgi:hypothetical protein